MIRVSVLLLTAGWLRSCLADINVQDYVYWKKADINAWHDFFPSRVMQEELQTVHAAIETVSYMDNGMNASLSGIVAFQAQELQTALMQMAGTPAQGCVNGIADYMTNAIDDAYSKYDDCTADANSKFTRLEKIQIQNQIKYSKAYNRTLAGIDTCVKTYPNKDSIDRLKSCVDSMYSYYFAAANSTMKSMFPSPSMSYFQQNVVQCASAAAASVTAQGYKFLKMLIECATISGTIDTTAYAEELRQWKGFNDTLSGQISDSQEKNWKQVESVENEMMTYYYLRKNAMETYVIESRGFYFYLNQLYGYLSQYFNTVTAAFVDNPGDPNCYSNAQAALNTVASAGAGESEQCDLNIVENTKQLMVNVSNNFQALNGLMPTIGNVAILGCLSSGHIFAPNTVAECFNLVYSGFDVEHSSLSADNAEALDVLTGYKNSFYSGSSFPCGNSTMKRALLGGQTALYGMERCLYITSGTTYFVTTYNPVTSDSMTYTTTPSYNSTYWSTISLQ